MATDLKERQHAIQVADYKQHRRAGTEDRSYNVADPVEKVIAPSS